MFEKAKHSVRLACLIHAASVRSEPGSNSPKKMFEIMRLPYGNPRLQTGDISATKCGGPAKYYGGDSSHIQTLRKNRHYTLKFKDKKILRIA